MKLLAIVAVLTASAAIVRCQPATGEARYIGKAGDVFISEEEFLRRFEMLPALYRHRKPKLNEAKLELLYAMIAEKLLAQEALARGLDKDSLYLQSMASLREMLARDELYREEILGKATLMEPEVRRGISQAMRQLLVAYLYFEREEDAHFARSQIRTSRDFDDLQIDSTMRALRDTATIVWGEAESPIETAAFSLRRGVVSPVIMASRGFYIMRVLKDQLSGKFASLSPEDLRSRVIEILRKREEEALADRFVSEVVRDKVGYSRPGPFRLLTTAMMDAFKQDRQDTLIYMNGELADAVRQRCSAVLADTFAVAGSTFWTTGEVIDILSSRQFRVHRDNLRSIPRMVNDNLRYLAQQELLGQEALRRGLDKSPAVQRDLQMWGEADLAAIMKRYVSTHSNVTDAEVWSYLKSKKKDLPVPRVQIQELRTRSFTDMAEALADLQQGKSFGQVIQEWSIDPEARTTNGITAPFPITDREPVGEVAWQMDVGQRYGPIDVKEGVLYFALVAKDSAAVDTTEAAQWTVARDELLSMTRKRTVTLLLAKAAKDRGYAIYADRLEQLKVSPTPMMTFRFLGFGGRMFAVPFVDPLLDWVGTEPPDTQVLP